MAPARGREVSCVCSFTKLTLSCSSLLLSPQTRFFQAVGGWWRLTALWSVSSTMSIPNIDRMSSGYWVQQVPFYFYPSHLFSHVLHTVCKENSFTLCFQLMDGQLKNRSPWWKRDAHIHRLSHYITVYRTESWKWITGFNKEETGLINTPTFMQSKIRALPQHAIETATKCCKICRHK